MQLLYLWLEFQKKMSQHFAGIVWCCQAAIQNLKHFYQDRRLHMTSLGNTEFIKDMQVQHSKSQYIWRNCCQPVQLDSVFVSYKPAYQFTIITIHTNAREVILYLHDTTTKCNFTTHLIMGEHTLQYGVLSISGAVFYQLSHCSPYDRENIWLAITLGAVETRSIFFKILTKTPDSSPARAMYGVRVFCGLKFWCIFCLSYWSDVCNIMLLLTTL